MDARGLEADEKVSANKKLGRDTARELLDGAQRLVAMKGRKLDDVDVSSGAGDETLDLMLGTTGNLRAPTLKVGATVLVGFNEEVYESVLDA